jgi:NADPH:quinone reductase-like Zn-dependent oxidoreductase
MWTAYGPSEVLQLQEIETPTPKDNEVLIRIRATTVTTGDCEQRNLKLPFWLALPMRVYVGLLRPKRITILGMELAGEIEAIGKAVTRFQVGDDVFAATGFADMGTYTEYICLPEDPDDGALAKKPTNMTFEEAAPVPVGGLEALHFLRQANIQRGQKVLINGAGGTIGTFAVQLAKYFGADVTGVDSTGKLDMLWSIGVDHVIDYTQEDFTERGETYNVIFDVVGKSSFYARARSVHSLKPYGYYLLANPGLVQMMRALWTSRISNKNVIVGAASRTTKDLFCLKELIEAGKIQSVIDRTYPLEQIPTAHHYVETGHKIGHVVITIDHELAS